MSRWDGAITLLTDFGHRDPYVGIMKGVMLGIAPGATLVDLTHEVPPQNVAVGAYLFSTAWPYFPEGTVHMAVVDPGVGGGRAVLVVEGGGHYFVGPDNGLLESALSLPDAKVYRVEGATYLRGKPSNTFHGRDIFSPLAAHLRAGVQPRDLGGLWREPQRLPSQSVKRSGGGLEGRIIAVDVFGNLITNILAEDLAGLSGPVGSVRVGEARGISGVSRTYVDVGEGEALALVGSTGRLEISIRGGSAAAMFNVGLGGGGSSRCLKATAGEALGGHIAPAIPQRGVGLPLFV